LNARKTSATGKQVMPDLGFLRGVGKRRKREGLSKKSDVEPSSSGSRAGKGLLILKAKGRWEGKKINPV